MDESDAESVLSTDEFRDGLKGDFLQAITKIKVQGSFVSFGELSEPPPSGFHVYNVGKVTMPLSEAQARQLIKNGHQASLHKRSETTVDTSTRNTWELDAGRFIFKKPDWQSYIQPLCERVAKELGINTTIRAELHKMLIYEKGAMFKARADTQKIPGMFGRLIVSLPSPHEGGEIVVKHCGQQKILKTSEYSQSFICWYSDVSHKVRPVTSGYLWVLTYNLAIDQSQPRPSAAVWWSGARSLRHTLKRWLAKDDASCDQPWVYHVLDHDYTKAEISLSGLEAQDLAQAQALQQVCSDLPVHIFLVLLEKSESGEPLLMDDKFYPGKRYPKNGCSWIMMEGEVGFHLIHTVDNTDYCINTLVDLNGQLVARCLDLEENNVFIANRFEDVRAEGYFTYLGEGEVDPIATHRYRRTAIAIVPQKKILSFLGLGGKNRRCLAGEPPELISYVAKLCMQQPTDLLMTRCLVKLCRSIWNVHSLVQHTQAMQAIFSFSLRAKRYDLFKIIADRFDKGHLPLAYFDSARHALFTESTISQVVFNSLKKFLSAALDQYPSLADQIKAIVSFSFSELEPMPDYIVEWARELLSTYTQSEPDRLLGGSAGAALVDLVSCYGNPMETLTTRVVPKVKSRIRDVEFCLGFLNGLYKQATEGVLSKDVSSKKECVVLLEAILDEVIASVDPSKMRSKRGICFLSLSTAENHRIISHKELASLFSVLIKLKSGKDIGLISKLIQSTPQLISIELHYMWVPFLQALMPIMEDVHTTSLQHYRSLFNALLNAYIDRYVDVEPNCEESLVRPKVHCGCGDCQLLINFLTSPTEKIDVFRINKERRNHLLERLNSHRICCDQEMVRGRRLPYPLRITKTSDDDGHKEHKHWERRWKRARKELTKFNQHELKILLGSDYSMVSELVNTEPPPRGKKRKMPHS
ncbi:hypothetical protein BGZ63DRAFT_457202 [Mariannaea sp. PMI_226]|nr:hypothetical protein BGZ63DRAFT_457202 [Mariannaea sp. PMI_226]